MLTVGIENDPDVITVAQWLGGLLLLGGVPFDHLAADARMLPAESIRFFYIDPNWTGAMIDGALSVGLGSSEESAIQAVLTTQLERMALDAALAQRASALGQPPSRPPTGPICGLLIRSALVTGWPGLVVKGFLAGAKTDLLRLEVIAPNVLVCLFNGVPDTVTLEQPHEGLAFGVDDMGAIVTRKVSPPTVTNGAEIVIYNPQAPGAASPTLRAGGMRVLNIISDPHYPTASPPPTPTDLLGQIAKALNVGTVGIDPALFAVQMIKGPEELSFSPSPPMPRE
jgi:hypothetical protein